MNTPSFVAQKSVWLSALVLAGTAFLLRWLEYQYVSRILPTEYYTVILAALFTALGIWIGTSAFTRQHDSTFQPNLAVIQTLHLSRRELDVLSLLAQGYSNQEIARQLFIANSTIKTHLVHIYQKLNVTRRTQAVQKARSLSIIS